MDGLGFGAEGGVVRVDVVVTGHFLRRGGQRGQFVRDDCGGCGEFMHGHGRGRQFGKFGRFGGEGGEAFFVCLHGFDGDAGFSELAGAGGAVVADEEEEKDGEDAGAADDAAGDARFGGGGKTGAIRVKGIFEGEELSAYDADVGGVGSDVIRGWGGDERE